MVGGGKLCTVPGNCAEKRLYNINSVQVLSSFSISITLRAPVHVVLRLCINLFTHLLILSFFSFFFEGEGWGVGERFTLEASERS